MSDIIRIDTQDGSFNAYVARPAAARAPVVVVLHEVFGVNADMRQTCDELAAQGYLAVCPDLLWRIEPGIALTDRTPAEVERAVELYNAFDLAMGVDDAARTVLAARLMRGSNGKVGVVGYCLGGLLAMLTTARLGPDAAVAYYPGGADRHLDVASRIDSPLLVHLAQQDEYIPAPAQAAISQALSARPGAQVHLYPGCDHAFARRNGTHRDEAAAALANGRTAAFLAAHLAA